MVIITTIITPILLKVVFKKGPVQTPPVVDGLSERFEELGRYRSGGHDASLLPEENEAAGKDNPSETNKN